MATEINRERDSVRGKATRFGVFCGVLRKKASGEDDQQGRSVYRDRIHSSLFSFEARDRACLEFERLHKMSRWTDDFRMFVL